MEIENCDLSALAELMGPDADELDAIAMREFLRGIVNDTDELDDEAWLACMDGAMLDVLRLDPVGLDAKPPVLTVMRGGATVCAAVCTLDPDNYPPQIGRRLEPHYDALCRWAEVRGLFSDVVA